MTIYQVHKMGGSWEDSYDFICGTFLHKEKAEMFNMEMNNKYMKSLHCNNCPIEYYNTPDCDSDLECEYCKDELKCIEKRIKKTKEYCNNFVLHSTRTENGRMCVSCKNFDYVIDDNVEYYIKEETVIE